MSLPLLLSIIEITNGIVVIVSLVIVARQLRMQRIVTRSQFIDSLASDIDKLAEFEVRMYHDGELYEYKSQLDASDRRQIWQYINFFERIFYILKNKAMYIETLDGLFGYRFLLLALNPNVIRHILSDKNIDPQSTFAAFISLRMIWLQYRLSVGKSLPRNDTLELIQIRAP